MKVIYIGGTCEFCEHLMVVHPTCWQDTSYLVKGRAYTVSEKWPVEIDYHKGFGIRLMEHPLPPGWGYCSCQFREIDGDDDAWQKIMEKNRPKTKELEPV